MTRSRMRRSFFELFPMISEEGANRLKKTFSLGKNMIEFTEYDSTGRDTGERSF